MTETAVSPEIIFAQKLAANEQVIRNRAIKRLKKYLSARSRHEAGLSETDLLKIWKGLFYCMWMQDKPIIQEELSGRITNLVHCFPSTADSLKFVKVFLETQSREWNNIDKLRLDKFMMMVREMIQQTFVLLSKEDWQEDSCRSFAMSLYKNVMNAHEPRLPDGLKLHLADIFVDELQKVSVDSLSSRCLLILLQPFVEYILFTSKIEQARRVMSEVIYKVLEAASSECKENVESSNTPETGSDLEDMEVEEQGQPEEKSHALNINAEVLMKLLFHMAGQKCVRAPNRCLVYNLMKKRLAPTEGADSVLKSDMFKQDDSLISDFHFLNDGGKPVEGQQAKQRQKPKKKKLVLLKTSAQAVVSDTNSKQLKKEKKKEKPKKLKNASIVTDQENTHGANSPDTRSSHTVTMDSPRLCPVDFNENSQTKAATHKQTSKLGNNRQQDDVSPSTPSSKAEKCGLKKRKNDHTELPPKKRTKLESADKSVSEPTDTNNNARPRTRSNSPPKSPPQKCPSPKSPIQLVLYTPDQKQYTVKGKLSTTWDISMSAPAASVAAVESDMSISEGQPAEALPPAFTSSGSPQQYNSVYYNDKAEFDCDPQSTTKNLIPRVNLASSCQFQGSADTPEIQSLGAVGGQTSPPDASAKKKVIFDLRKNRANKFQDYLKSLAKQPDSPHVPGRNPTASILKSPVSSPATSASSSEASVTETTYKKKKLQRRNSAPSGGFGRSSSKKKKKKSSK